MESHNLYVLLFLGLRAICPMSLEHLAAEFRVLFRGKLWFTSNRHSVHAVQTFPFYSKSHQTNYIRLGKKAKHELYGHEFKGHIFTHSKY